MASRIVFVDESGSPSPADGKRFFVVAALVTGSSRAIDLRIKRARRTLRLRSPMSELKASSSRPVVIKRLLGALAQEECDIYAVVVDTQGVKEEQAERVYRTAVGRVILHCVWDYPDLHVYLDKRYTNRRQRIELEHTIRQTIASVSDHVVIIDQVDSMAYPGLQAVDFVAWAMMQKHEMAEDWAAAIIAQRIAVEEIVAGIKLAARPGGR